MDAAIAASPDFAAYLKRGKLQAELSDQDGFNADLQRVAELTSRFNTTTETTGRIER